MKPAAVLFALSSMTALAVATPLPPGEWDSSDVYFFDDINFEGNIFTFPALMRDGECGMLPPPPPLPMRSCSPTTI